MNNEIGRIDKSLTLNLGCATLIVLAVGALLYPVFATPSHGHRRSCAPNVKQLVTCSQIYCADFDDRMPPYFTFDFPTKWHGLGTKEKIAQHPAKRFKDALNIYMKNDQTFLCVSEAGKTSDQEPKRHREGMPNVMSFVHSLNLRGAIANYATGGRELDTRESAIPYPATVAFMRDPIRGWGKTDEGTMSFLSPHTSVFFVSYLDGHMKSTKTLDPITQL